MQFDVENKSGHAEVPSELEVWVEDDASSSMPSQQIDIAAPAGHRDLQPGRRATGTACFDSGDLPTGTHIISFSDVGGPSQGNGYWSIEVK